MTVSPARGLVDTGALLALLDRDDRWHRRCADAFAALPLPLASSPKGYHPP
jgi:predicted nucleic acid-binding protein